MWEAFFGWTTIGILVPFFVGGGLWGFMSMSPPEYDWAKILVSLGALLLVAKTGVWLVLEADMAASHRIIFAVVVFGLSGAGWVESWRWIDARQDLANSATQTARSEHAVSTKAEKTILQSPSQLVLERSQSAVNTPLPPQSRFIRDSITNLIDELLLLSGKQYSEECEVFLNQTERWYSEDKRLSLFSLMHGKLSMVKQLGQVHSALWAIEGGFLFSPIPAKLGGGRMVTPGYGRVHDEYQSILSKPWVLTKTKYKIGTDPSPSPDFKTCAYGFIPLDGQFERLKAALDDAEAIIRATPLPDRVPQFRIDWLHADLHAAKIPLDGLNVSEKNEQDATPAEYFQLKDGKFIRITKQKEITYTEAQKQKISEIIRLHESTIDKQEPVLEAVRIAIARAGVPISSVRFTRAAVELRFDPQKFVSLDTALGIIEVRSYTPFSSEQRKLVTEAIKDAVIKTIKPT